MELISLTQCKSDQAALKKQAWPDQLPGLAIHGHLLVQSESSQVFNCVLPAQCKELTEFLVASLPEPGLSQIAGLLDTTWFTEIVNTSEWLKAYGVPSNSQALATLKKLRELPDPFQDWVDAKKLSYREIATLAVVEDLQPLKAPVVKISELGMSHQQGVQALEWLCEVTALGTDLTPLSSTEGLTRELWLSQLKKMRFPLISSMDTHLEKKAKELRLPKQVKAAWLRRGDVSGIELRLFATSIEDLSMKLEKIEQMKTEIDNYFFKGEVN